MEIRRHPQRLRAVAILTVLGSPSYVLCFLWHVCIGGHMQHGPYSAIEWINDLLWTGCFAAVIVFSITVHAKRRAVFCVGSIALVLSRLVLGSLGGRSALVELPLLVVMNVYAIEYIVGPTIFLWSGEKANGFQPSEPRKTRVSFCLAGLLLLAALVVWQHFHR